MAETQTQTELSPPNISLHRNQHNPSKLPSYRITDRSAGSILATQSAVSAGLPALTFAVYHRAQPALSQNESESSTMNNPNPPASNPADKPTSMSSTISTEVSSPKIPPIRSFRKSRSSNSDMHGLLNSHRHATDDDDITLKAPENNPGALSDDSDLFLNIAKEEANMSRNNSQRLSRVSLPTQRSSLPPPKTSYQPIILARRRGSDQDARTGSRSLDEQGMERVLTYKSRDRPPTNRYFAKQENNNNNNNGGGGGTTSHRSAPTTPRTGTNREVSPPESLLTSVSRRPSVPDSTLLPPRTTYRQSTLSTYGNTRTYNSSPLVARTTDANEGQEHTPRGAEGTESTVSTTAPSTVWDELEDLKSRIHRLEKTGKLPESSGPPAQQVSGDRPPTATTTVTTVSLSPKRARGNSLSPTEVLPPPSMGTQPLLRSALEKSKPILAPEVYKALEATAMDALAISSMMGMAGQPGPISSSQSVIGGGPPVAVSDRQVRRKADSMCRSLTELCLALSESKTEGETPTTNGNAPPPKPPPEAQIPRIAENIPRPPVSNDLSRTKLSPRPLSRLEARRSSLLATSSLPAPRFNPPEATTPTQAALAHRRASLMFRARRTAPEEPAEEQQHDGDESPSQSQLQSRLRAPSRATTDLGRSRNAPTLQPLVTDRPSPTSQSSLPVRRSFLATGLSKSTATSPSVTGRRYFDRGVTPERDPGHNNLATPSSTANGQGSSPNGRLAVNEAGERIHRKPSSSMSQAVTTAASNLARRTRQTSSMDAAVERQTATAQQ